METKEKYIRMNFSTWREFKHFFPRKRGESAADYFQRILDDIIIKTETMK